ncbi:hypothetical protein D3C86_1211820 [compost metagenome]
MTERPILFSGPMVKAILDGHKTQTRRLVKTQPPEGSRVMMSTSNQQRPWSVHFGNDEGFGIVAECPYGWPGDRLWVRETWAAVPNTAGCEKYGAGFDPKRSEVEQYRAGVVFDPEGYRYRATWEKTHGARWRPPIHMPRKASRILLEIVSVRVERLQEISSADATAEGINWNPGTAWTFSEARGLTDAYRSQFADLWDSINSKRGLGWDTNPWVWAITFRRLTP